MPVASTDIKYRLSGGSGNSSPAASLGGVMSTTTEWGAALHDLFDAVASAESVPGDTEYRGFYGLNNHGTIAVTDARVYLTTAADDMDIALGGEAVNVDMEVIANESTAPIGETFSHPVTYATALVINGATGLIAGARKGIWLRRIIPPVAGAESNHLETVKLEGDTV